MLGAQGFLGSYFVAALGDKAVLHLNRINQESSDNHFSLHLTPESLEKLADIVQVYKPDFVVNCVAATNLDFCESNPEISFFLNEQVPMHLAQLSNLFGFKLVHISTDAVFSGEKVIVPKKISVHHPRCMAILN